MIILPPSVTTDDNSYFIILPDVFIQTDKTK